MNGIVNKAVELVADVTVAMVIDSDDDMVDAEVDSTDSSSWPVSPPWAPVIAIRERASDLVVHARLWHR